MTADAFSEKYHPLLMGWLIDGYVLRHSPPSSVGMLIDQRFNQLNDLLRRMHADIEREVRVGDKPVTNGHAARVPQKA